MPFHISASDIQVMFIIIMCIYMTHNNMYIYIFFVVVVVEEFAQQ